MERVSRAFPPILLLALLAAAPAAAGARETTIWLAVVDGQGYIRTGNTSWEANIERNPDVVLRIDGAEHPLRAAFVTDAALRTQIEQVFREKYGFSDSFIAIFRSGEPKIMHLVPR